jgi:hypothetical protein
MCGPRRGIATVRGHWDWATWPCEIGPRQWDSPGRWSPGGPVARAGGARKDDADGIER